MAQKRITDLDVALTMKGGELFEISQLSDTVLISAATISALASDNSFNDSAAGFVTAGFEVGNRVRVQGFTGDVANNLYVGSITALEAGKMTIGGTDGDVIVDDAAGETVVITKWTSRRIDFATLVATMNKYGSVIQAEGGDYTIDADDVGHFIRFTSATTKTVTVELDATAPLPAAGEWHVRNAGPGDLTFVGVSGVTINAPNGGTLVVPFGGTVTLKRAAANVFDLLGQTVAA